jgi:hypothetical protein
MDLPGMAVQISSAAESFCTCRFMAGEWLFVFVNVPSTSISDVYGNGRDDCSYLRSHFRRKVLSQLGHEQQSTSGELERSADSSLATVRLRNLIGPVTECSRERVPVVLPLIAKLRQFVDVMGRSGAYSEEAVKARDVVVLSVGDGGG